MAIFEPDIQLLESERLTDADDGGGRLTGNVVESGQANNLFPDISSLDRTMGRVSLRKAYPAVRSPNQDTYYGAHLMVAEPPEDPTVSVTLFDTGSWTDLRQEAQSRLESYLFKGPLWHGYLRESHISGMQQIAVVQRIGTELPPVGKTLVLVQDEGTASEKEQYVRVINVSYEEREFTVNVGSSGEITYKRWIVSLDLSDPLQHDFDGHTVTENGPQGSDYDGKTRLRDTTVADAQQYFGIQPLATAAVVDDRTIQLGSMFTQLVPNVRNEEPLVDRPMNPELARTVNAGTRDVEVYQQAHTFSSPVTVESRRLNWITRLSPIPAPETLTVSFRSQGQWYTLSDDGAGNLVPALSGAGAGTVDYTTGDTAVSLSALPDAGSQVMYVWASPVHYTVRAGAESDVSTWGAQIRHDLAHERIVANSLTVEWLHDGALRTATSDSAGSISGTGLHSTSALDATDGSVFLVFADAPDPETTIIFDYQWQEPDDPALEPLETIEEALSDYNSHTITVPQDLSGVAGEIVAIVPLRVRRQNFTVVAKDDGAGTLVVQRYLGATPSKLSDPNNLIGMSAGTVDYTNGLITLEAIGTIQATYWNVFLKEWFDASSYAYLNKNQQVVVKYPTVAPATAQSNTENYELATDGIVIDLTSTISSPVVPNSIEFSVFGVTLSDRTGDLVDNGGLVHGTMNYDTGHATMRLWAQGTSYSPSVDSCLTVFGPWTASNSEFRTAIAPLVPESVQVLATAEDGTQISVTADQDGNLSSSNLLGTVDYQTGVAAVEFGSYVDDSSLTAAEKEEPWYDPANVEDDGTIWRQIAVMPSTIRYNAVAFSYIPLDADILGLNPVRLPADGRVPFIRPGNVAVVHNTQTTDLGAGDTVTDLGRTRLSYAHVYDSTGARVPDDQLETDLDAGTVRVSDATGFTAPFHCEHRIEDMRLVSEAQITGAVTLTSGLSHDFPADSSYLSTALLYGDMQAAVGIAFDQQTWTGEWADAQIGDSASGTYNQTDYPIAVTNEGAIQERWRLEFTQTNAVNVIGEYTGQILTGASIDEVIAPINPTSGAPYFSIDPAGWGGGWSTGNVLRFDTRAANRPVWIARTVLASDERTESDSFRIQTRGDAN